MKGTQFK